MSEESQSFFFQNFMVLKILQFLKKKLVTNLLLQRKY
jgi:hypothetical protein